MKNIRSKKLPAVYFENLDALRFIAFFVVFLHHVFSLFYYRTSNPYATEFISRCLQNGNLGVNFFFVLSGFLITYLLLKEKEQTDTIRIGAFYMRRILRIWPVYFLVLIICFYIIPGLGGYAGDPKLNRSLYFFFLGNFDLVKNGVGNFLVSVLWSVSIEEQFYLFWPLFMSFIPVKHLVKFLAVVVIVSILFRIYGHTGKSLNLMLSYHTLSAVYNLAIGGFIAYLATLENMAEKFRRIGRPLIIAVYVAGLALIILQKDILALEPRGVHHYIMSVLPLFYALFFAFVIVEQVYSEHSLFKVGKIPYFSKLGTISYGLYCYHLVIIFLVGATLTSFGFNVPKPDGVLFTVEVILSFAFSVLVASASYRFIEKRFLQYKSNFR